ncbi:hypothetical protein HZH68_005730 [Vespula germanica]|uniref:Uncharacterized protein n=1 Tax=Vespula germanica TaxID=30212 RepID=A0A834KI87_VESGE|nr:hypothetical protein HZH68_005730 [Vespula germanica]
MRKTKAKGSSRINGISMMDIKQDVRFAAETSSAAFQNKLESNWSTSLKSRSRFSLKLTLFLPSVISQASTSPPPSPPHLPPPRPPPSSSSSSSPTSLLFLLLHLTAFPTRLKKKIKEEERKKRERKESITD